MSPAIGMHGCVALLLGLVLTHPVAAKRKQPAPHFHVVGLLQLVPEALAAVVETATVGPLEGKAARDVTPAVLGNSPAAGGAQAYIERWYAGKPAAGAAPVARSIYVRAFAFASAAQAKVAATAAVDKAAAQGWNPPEIHIVGSLLVVRGEAWRQPISNAELAAARSVAAEVKKRVAAFREKRNE